MIAPLNPLRDAAAKIAMSFLPPPPNYQRFEDKSERDLLIRLSVKMEHLQRTVLALTWAVGLMLAGIVPFSFIMAAYAAILWMLWRGGP